MLDEVVRLRACEGLVAVHAVTRMVLICSCALRLILKVLAHRVLRPSASVFLCGM
jgi:hypothetical protein